MTEPKHARDMTADEYAATLSKLRRGPATAAPPQPVDQPERTAKTMSEQERAEWLQNHRRKFR
jgi:hypothetical protein